MEFNEKQISIIKAAEQLISEKGFEASTVREISARAEVNLAMINYYFGSKEKLLEALFLLKSSQLRITTDLVVKDTTLNSLEKIIKLSENYFEKVFSNFSFHKIMLKDTAYLESTVAYDQINKMKTSNFDVLSEVINEGILNGEFNPNVNIDAVISVVNGTMSNYALNEKFYRKRWNLEEKKAFADQTKSKIKNQIIYCLKAILTYEEKTK